MTEVELVGGQGDAQVTECLLNLLGEVVRDNQAVGLRSVLRSPNSWKRADTTTGLDSWRGPKSNVPRSIRGSRISTSSATVWSRHAKPAVTTSSNVPAQNAAYPIRPDRYKTRQGHRMNFSMKDVLKLADPAGHQGPW